MEEDDTIPKKRESSDPRKSPSLYSPPGIGLDLPFAGSSPGFTTKLILAGKDHGTHF
jgi:hypothetical protein